MADYVVGDIHGNQILWYHHIHPMLRENDRVMIAGDFGVGFWIGQYWSEELFYDFLEQQPYTVLFCDGNHEDFSKLNAYPVSEWNGGHVHKIRENVIHLMRVKCMRLMEKRCLHSAEVIHMTMTFELKDMTGGRKKCRISRSINELITIWKDITGKWIIY